MDDSLRLEARRARGLRGELLFGRLLSVPVRDRDDWVDELLGLEDAPPDAALPRGAVPYLPCGVREILAILREAPIRPDDELVDLGSGLGRVALLVHLLSGARTRGIEIQEQLVRLAEARAAALALRDVSFVHGDAATTALDGSVFFLYAPFNGPLLTAVLANLETVARRRRIVVCTVDLELHGVPWLSPRASPDGAISLYDSVSSAIRE